MAVLVLNCPHCGANNVTFKPWAHRRHEKVQTLSTLATSCSVCLETVVFVLQTPANPAWDYTNEPGDLLADSRIKVVKRFPKSAPLEAPADTPEPIARAFLEAAANRKDRRPSSACVMYRRAMELALKAFSPDVEAWKIEKRIDKLAADHRITPEIQAWAHELRLDGNGAVHEADEATMEMADGMHSLCWFLLTYLYTLPSQVNAAKQRRESPSA